VDEISLLSAKLPVARKIVFPPKLGGVRGGLNSNHRLKVGLHCFFLQKVWLFQIKVVSLHIIYGV